MLNEVLIKEDGQSGRTGMFYSLMLQLVNA